MGERTADIYLAFGSSLLSAGAATVSGEQDVPILSLIHAAAMDAMLWPQVMAAMAQAVGPVKTHLFEHDATRNGTVIFATHGFSDESLESFTTCHGPLNSWAPGWSSAPLGTPIPSAAICADERILQTEFCADRILPQENILGGGGMVLARGNGRVILFGGNFRQRDRDRLTPLWLALLGRVGPSVRHALDVNRKLAALSQDLYLARQGVGDLALLLLGRGNRVLSANTAGEGLLASGRVQIGALGQLLALPDPLAEQTRSRAVDGALNRGRSSRAVPLGPGVRAEILPYEPGLAAEISFGPISPHHGPFALILASDEAQLGRGDPLSRYGLTLSERRIALALAGGATVGQIAEDRGASLHTVRNQIKSILSKTGTGRQVELVALVAGLRK